MYGQNSGALRSQLAVLLRQHRILYRIGSPYRHANYPTTSEAERRALGAQIARYRHFVLIWCTEAVRATHPGPYPERDTIRSGPDAVLLRHLEAATAAPAADVQDLSTPQRFPLVEIWRQAARAATLGEHDFHAGVGYGALSEPQRLTVLKDAAEVARALVILDRRYDNIPDWPSLPSAGHLARAAQACQSLAARGELDYSVDQRGWRPAPRLIDGPGRAGMSGVLQAQHNLTVHLANFPDALSLRAILDSQRLLSGTAAQLLDADSPLALTWRHREQTYQHLVKATRDLGGLIGTGGPAVAEAALAVARIKKLTRSDCTDPTPCQRLSALFRHVDRRLARVIEQGAGERLYFMRAGIQRPAEAPNGVVRWIDEYVPARRAVTPDLFGLTVELRYSRKASEGANGGNRAEFQAAIDHRPGQAIALDL